MLDGELLALLGAGWAGLPLKQADACVLALVTSVPAQAGRSGQRDDTYAALWLGAAGLQACRDVPMQATLGCMDFLIPQTKLQTCCQDAGALLTATQLPAQCLHCASRL